MVKVSSFVTDHFHVYVCATEINMDVETSFYALPTHDHMSGLVARKIKCGGAMMSHEPFNEYAKVCVMSRCTEVQPTKK